MVNQAALLPIAVQAIADAVLEDLLDKRGALEALRDALSDDQGAWDALRQDVGERTIAVYHKVAAQHGWKMTPKECTVDMRYTTAIKAGVSGERFQALWEEAWSLAPEIGGLRR